MKAYNNKNLLVGRHIILNDKLDKVLSEIDSYWTFPETVTSAVRIPEDQLRIIRNYLRRKGLDDDYPEAMTCDIRDRDTNGQYRWQMGWSALLNKGVIINPPFPAECLMDYFRNGQNKKGMVIGQSPHTRGAAFDLSGLDSLEIVKQLLIDGKIRGYLVERENNCIHVDI